MEQISKVEGVSEAMNNVMELQLQKALKDGNLTEEAKKDLEEFEKIAAK